MTHALRSDDYRQGIRLQKNLLPQAGVHRRGQIQELQSLVSDLKEMTKALKLELVGTEEHCHLGQKGIFPVEPKVTETKPLKPKLNTNDLFEL